MARAGGAHSFLAQILKRTQWPASWVREKAAEAPKLRVGLKRKKFAVGKARVFWFSLEMGFVVDIGKFDYNFMYLVLCKRVLYEF
jgi:hypothetical protein